MAIGGGATRDELMARMTAREFACWLAIDTYIEPLGDRRGDLQAAVIAQEIANRNLGSKERSYSLNDFLKRMRWTDPPRPKTPAELREAAHMLAAWGQGVNRVNSRQQRGGPLDDCQL